MPDARGASGSRAPGGAEDDEITQYFIDSAFPDAEVFQALRPLYWSPKRCPRWTP